MIGGGESPVASVGGLAGIAVLRPATIDDLSPIRYLHASALRAHGAAAFTDEELDAFRSHVYSASYGDALLRQNVTTAWIGDQLVATAGWTAGDDSGETARMRMLFVHPMFVGHGLGRHMLSMVEQQANLAGFRVHTLRATANAIGFFERAGYAITSHGVRSLSPTVSLAVAFMRKEAGGAETPERRLPPRPRQ